MDLYIVRVMIGYYSFLYINVPADMCEQVIRSCHDELCHVGENKTIELIKMIYWFPKLTESVKNIYK
jgi:hypothetical protein